jgi:hypothetical protein
MTEIMYAMMIWIASVTGLSVTEAPPYPPVYVNERVMTYILHGCSSEVNKETCKIILDEKSNNSVMGIFDHNTNNIYLNQSIRTLDQNIQDSILIHELVHYMQFQNNTPYTCLGELEKDAYRVQSEWLIKHGRKDVYEELEISPLWVFIITGCADSDMIWDVPPDSESTAK